MRKTSLRYAAVLAGCLALAGCLGDPAPHPSVAPLEVVLDTCTLNRESVQVGMHQVAAVGGGLATFVDPQGQGAFQVDASGMEPPEYQLAAGQWQVRCEAPDGSESTASLQVDPAE